jgi:hypothetical protein
MKLEFLRDGTADCPLIRLYHFDKMEVRRLKAIFDSLSTGVLREVALHFEPGIDAVDGCQVYLNVGKSDLGFAERERLTFEGKLTTTTWADVASLASPFCTEDLGGRYQWLNEDGPVSLLLSDSANGTW